MSNWGQNKPVLGSQVNWNHPLSKSLVGCWLFNEGAGNKVRNVALNTSSELNTNLTWVTTNKGTSIAGGTSNAAGVITKIPFIGASDWTCVFTYNNFRDNGISQLANGIMQVGSTAGTRQVLQIHETYGERMVVGLYSDDKTFNYTKSISNFDMYAITHNKSKVMNVYRNGVSIAAPQTTAGLLSPVGTSQILATPVASRFFKGYILNLFFFWRALSSTEIKDLYIAPYQFIYKPRRVFYSIPTGVTLSGTILNSTTETDIRTGGKTIILTLTGDTWVDSGATFDGQRQNIIDGIDSAQSEATGWDAEVKAKAPVTDVERTSPTEVTITLSAQSGYDITSTETITATVPASALTGGQQLVASPTFSIIPVSAGTWGHKIYGINNANIGKVNQFDKTNIEKVNGV